MKRAIGSVIVVGLLIAAKVWLMPWLSIRAEQAAGTGWDDAHAELLTTYQEAMESWENLDLGADTKLKISQCITDKAITFLNTTDCRYKYNQTTTSMAEHLTEQEKCMETVKFEEKEFELTMECAKEHIPSDWKQLQRKLAEEFTAAFKDKLPAAQTKTVGACVADKAVQFAGVKGCDLVNREATTADDQINSLDTCLGDNTAPIAEFAKTCAAASGVE